MAQQDVSGEAGEEKTVQIPHKDREIIAATIGNRKRMTERRGANTRWLEQIGGYQEAFEPSEVPEDGEASSGVISHAVAGVVWMLTDEFENESIGHTDELVACVERLQRRHEAIYEEEGEQRQREYAVDAIEDVRDELLDVEMDRLPPSVRERYARGSEAILDALGEAEALARE